MRTYAPEKMFRPADADKEDLRALRDALDAAAKGGGRVAIIAETGERVPIPPSALVALNTIVDRMAAADAIALTTFPESLTIGQAAALLNASRAHINGLIEAGELELVPEGTRQRVALQDVLDHQAEIRRRRRDALAELIRISEEAGCYDEE